MCLVVRDALDELPQSADTGSQQQIEGLLHTRPEHADTHGGADRLVVSAEAPFGAYRGAAKIDLPVSPCFLHYGMLRTGMEKALDVPARTSDQ